jgi:hypothetical protein
MSVCRLGQLVSVLPVTHAHRLDRVLLRREQDRFAASVLDGAPGASQLGHIGRQDDHVPDRDDLAHVLVTEDLAAATLPPRQG